MSAKQQGADATQGRWLVIPRNLCLITYENEILLLKRAPHKRVFPNRYNGLGGHLERGEDTTTSAWREIQEESGLEVQNIQLRGIIHIDAGSENGILLTVYTAEALSQDVIQGEEGTLEWIPLEKVLEKDLVDDLPILIPLLFGENSSTKPFAAHVSYDEQDKMIFRFYE